MANVHPFPNPTKTLDEASKWLAKMDRGLDETEEAALESWLSGDPKNAEALVEIAEVWDRMDALSRLSELFPQPSHGQQAGGNHLRTLALAASFILVITLGFFTVDRQWLAPGEATIQQTAESSPRTFNTGTGEQSSVTLADGSVLTLNTDTRLSIQFSDRERSIRLFRGEVHINVAHDEQRPLRVYAADQLVEAVGTAFNLEITDQKTVELIVTEGKVRVGASTLGTQQWIEPPPSGIPSITPEPALITAGETVVLGADDQSIEQLDPEEIEVKLSWQQGNLVFRGESLEHAITEIQRYTTAEFIILDEDLKLVRVAGLFRAGDVEGLLTTLHENFNVNYRRDGNDRILLSAIQNQE